MKCFDVQSIEIGVAADTAFAFIADAQMLPRWAQAFAKVENGRALLRTPNGELSIALVVRAWAASGTIDWEMRFPDGSVGLAYSRLVALGTNRCLYSFVLTPPPLPLEQLEGALLAQSKTLAEELAALKEILENAR